MLALDATTIVATVGARLEMKAPTTCMDGKLMEKAALRVSIPIASASPFA
jgi:hypothetical protein